MAEEAGSQGTMIDAGGLLPSSQGTRIRVSAGKASVIDGPFAETKELVGGYAIFEVKSRQEAIESGKRFMQVHADILAPPTKANSKFGP
jgi:hypothetical protein